MILRRLKVISQPGRQNILAGLYISLFFSLFILAYYQIPLNDAMEDIFFDLRTRLKPFNRHYPDIVVVAITENSIKALEGTKRSEISISNFISIINACQQSKAQVIVPLFFQNIFPYNETNVKLMTQLMAADDRIVLGVLGFHYDHPYFPSLPKPWTGYQDRIRGVETLRHRSNSIVRTLPYAAYFGLKIKALLPAYIATKVEGRDLPRQGRYRLNFRQPHQFTMIEAEDLIHASAHRLIPPQSVVLIGHTLYRPWGAQTRDPLLVNTPLKGDSRNYLNGESLTLITANAIENLLHQTHLSNASPWIPWLQTAFCCLFILFAWSFGSLIGSLASIIIFVVLLLVHAYLMDTLNIFIPFADTFVFGSLALFTGAGLALVNELRLLAQNRLSLQTQQELEATQSHYLEEFAETLRITNQQILTLCQNLSTHQEPQSQQVEKLRQAALQTCVDFEEFLRGIQQLAHLKEAAPTAQKKSSNSFALVTATQAILDRHQQDIEQKHLIIENNLDVKIRLKVNKDLFDGIWSNLISNAIKYSPPHGRIILESEQKGSTLRIWVQDYGPGIPVEHQSKVFEKFYRIQDARNYHAKGTGLGLYLAKYFCEQLQIQLNLDSDGHTGSRFILTLKRGQYETA